MNLIKVIVFGTLSLVVRSYVNTVTVAITPTIFRMVTIGRRL